MTIKILEIWGTATSYIWFTGVRHFAESETLDHLPLTDPENFGTPVLMKRKQKRKTPQSSSTNADEGMYM